MKTSFIKSLCAILFFCLFCGNNALSQNVQIEEGVTQFRTYPYSNPDPTPSPGRMYPYFRFDGYTATPELKEWKTVTLENEFIKLLITPEIGGKIWGAVEKSTGKDFIYYNDAVKFRDVAMRGPWTSGGIEFNFGVIGHTPSCSAPVDYYVRKNDDGSVSCFVGTMDLPSRSEWRVEIRLNPNDAAFTTKALWYNPLPIEQSYYQWMNSGIKAAGNLEFYFPGNAHIGHDGDVSSWPVDQKGRKISMYEQNNFGTYKSYHVFGSASDFFGAYWHNDRFGMGHYSPYDDKPGRKVWIWGLAREGMIWEDLLTDTKGQYVELQTGRLFNQAVPGSTKTPFKHRSLHPYMSDEWTEHWFPVKDIGGISFASPEGTINMEQKNGNLNIAFCAVKKINRPLCVYYENTLLKSWEMNSNPMDVTTYTVPFTGEVNKISVKLGDELFFAGGTSENTISRPTVSPQIDWNSCYGLYMQGEAWARQREYKLAEEYFRKSIQSDPSFIPALTSLADCCIRKMEYEKALELLRKAVAINTYDPKANFLYGYVNRVLGNEADAVDGYSIASASVEYRAGAYAELANLYLAKANIRKAIHYAELCLQYNANSVPALETLAMAYRRAGLKENAQTTATEILRIDPLNHFARFEQYLSSNNASHLAEFKHLIRNEFPHETYLEIALKYHRTGNADDMLRVLNLSPDHPMIHYWKAYMYHTTGQNDRVKNALDKATEASPYLVFPFREESVPVLQWAAEKTNSWKPTYYLALIYWNKNRLQEARELIARCGDAPDYAPFYLAKAAAFKGVDSDVEWNSLIKAESLDGNNWRIGMLMTEYLIGKNENVRALETVKRYLKKDSKNYYLGLLYAEALLLNDKYTDCVAYLKNASILPNEGAIKGRLYWREANIKSAVFYLQKGKPDKAVEHIEMARQWPENLGIGKPYDTEERLEDLLTVVALQKSKKNALAEEYMNRIISPLNQQSIKSTDDFITALALKKAGKPAEADQIMNRLTEQSAEAKSVRWAKAIFDGDKHKANLILSEKDKEEDAMPYETVFTDRTFPLLVWIEQTMGLFEVEKEQ